MDATLKERAQQVAQLQNYDKRFTEAQIKEVAEVHHLLTGKTTNCTSCNVYRFISEINKILITEPLNITYTMATKGHFKSNAATAKIYRHGKNGTIEITSKNLNDGDNFEWASKRYPHLVAETKAAAEEEGETKTAKTTAKK
jgi:hypothetical protein